MSLTVNTLNRGCCALPLLLVGLSLAACNGNGNANANHDANVNINANATANVKATANANANPTATAIAMSAAQVATSPVALTDGQHQNSNSNSNSKSNSNSTQASRLPSSATVAVSHQNTKNNQNNKNNETSADTTPTCDNRRLIEQYQQQNPNRKTQVLGCGEVMKVLADDNDGSRHQKFLVRIDGYPQMTILIAHNIDLAPRVAHLRAHTSMQFYGEYLYQPKGGVVHWTHKDPAARHQDGWLEYQGKRYQ